jgi:uncharacterized protein (DUF2147 family)
MKRIALGVLLILLVGSGALLAQSPAGVWTDKDKNTFELSDTGTISGKIRSLNPPATKAGTPLLDIHNPDPARRKTPLVGLIFLQGFQPDGSRLWDHGTVYDPKSGKTYSCTLELEGADRLKVHGYIGFSVLGRTEIWTRVPGTAPL